MRKAKQYPVNRPKCWREWRNGRIWMVSEGGGFRVAQQETGPDDYRDFVDRQRATGMGCNPQYQHLNH